MMKQISISGPWITQKEVDYVTDAVTNAWYSNHNMYHKRFESQFAAYIGRKYAMTLPSGTSALHLALASLDIGPGDEVIVPEITWIASAAPIIYMGATPVFADIDPESWCLSVESFESLVSPKTKAVIVVDLYGNLPDMRGILNIADRCGIAVIEDAAQAIGSEYQGKKAGSFGIISAFSFHGTKTMTTGEGGMLVTDDEDIYSRSQFLRDHGRALGEKMFWNTEVAYKYKMSAMQAALGVAQLERIEELINHKRKIFSWYRELLDGVGWVTLNSTVGHIKNTYWMVTAVVDADFGLNKEYIIKEMAKNDIGCRPFFYPLSSLPAFENLPQCERRREENVNAYRISPYAINLPSGYNMTQEKVHYVCDRLKKILQEEKL